jgi:REP element-mobilizing transposase RayT
MSRKPRVHFPGALYHVISRGNRKQGIFLNEKDLKTFLAYLSDYKGRYPFRLYAYALMKNHVHLLMETPKANLSQIMQNIIMSYAVYVNRKYQRSGDLFQKQQKSEKMQN